MNDALDYNEQALTRFAHLLFLYQLSLVCLIELPIFLYNVRLGAVVYRLNIHTHTFCTQNQCGRDFVVPLHFVCIKVRFRIQRS